MVCVCVRARGGSCELSSNTILFWILPTCSPLPLFSRGEGEARQPHRAVVLFYRKLGLIAWMAWGFSVRVKKGGKRENQTQPGK